MKDIESAMAAFRNCSVVEENNLSSKLIIIFELL